MLETIVYSVATLIAILAWLIAMAIGAGAVVVLLFRVPFVPTPRKKVEQIIDLFELKPNDIFYDLGCGEGRFLIAAANRKAIARGFEVSPWAYLRARFNLWLHHSTATVRFKNFYTTNLSDADAVYCFLIDSIMPRVEKKLRQELKSGAKIICYGFKLPTWPADKIIETNPNNKRSSKIYCYRQK